MRDVRPNHSNVWQTHSSSPTANDTLFRSVYSPNDAPEVLFRRIEDCEEVQILG